MDLNDPQNEIDDHVKEATINMKRYSKYHQFDEEDKAIKYLWRSRIFMQRSKLMDPRINLKLSNNLKV